jgi:GDP/UDP-N,N'-diacetylbacillosamine 2-epimerase (hydrolysing)
MRILFPATNRVHIARQRLLLDRLQKHFDVDVVEYPTKYNYILNNVADIANYFRKVLGRNQYDLVLLRGDRYEVLPIAMMAAYKGIKIAHIEGGDLSGAVDNKVRYAITALADIHFATNKDSHKRLLNMGTDPDRTFDFGSLDVEYALSLMKEVTESKPYVVMCHHAMKGEDPALIEQIVREEFDGEVYVIKSNSDNGKPYGIEEFEPEKYIELISEATCLVGNSSSFLKEASVFGTPVVNIGSRQENRLMPGNVKSVAFDEEQIRQTLRIQLRANRHPSKLYYQADTSKRITQKLWQIMRSLKGI